MAATPLSSQYEKAPASPLPKGFIPFMGVPHRVIDGQNWASIAAYYGYSNPMDLIYYNYFTKDPREINYYLREHVGCHFTTSDGKNWRFTASANPGIIYVPEDRAKRARPVGPRTTPTTPAAPTMPTGELPWPEIKLVYRVPGHIPHIYQGRSNLCWACSAAMMMSWRDSKVYIDVLLAMQQVGSRWAEKVEDDEGLFAEEQDDFARAVGLTVESNVCMSPLGWYEALKQSGPLFLINRPLRGHHAFVLTGMQTSDPYDSVKAHYFVNDSAFAARSTMNGPAFDADVERMGGGDGLMRIYHFGPRWK